MCCRQPTRVLAWCWYLFSAGKIQRDKLGSKQGAACSQPAGKHWKEYTNLILGSNTGFMSVTTGESVNGIYWCTANPSDLHIFFL